MTFDDILEQALVLLQRRGRLTYRTLKRQFQSCTTHRAGGLMKAPRGGQHTQARQGPQDPPHDL